MKKPAELFSLNGKVAVVIGGTGELCGAMAEGMAAATFTARANKRCSTCPIASLCPLQSAGRSVIE